MWMKRRVIYRFALYVRMCYTRRTPYSVLRTLMCIVPYSLDAIAQWLVFYCTLSVRTGLDLTANGLCVNRTAPEYTED